LQPRETGKDLRKKEAQESPATESQDKARDLRVNRPQTSGEEKNRNLLWGENWFGGSAPTGWNTRVVEKKKKKRGKEVVEKKSHRQEEVKRQLQKNQRSRGGETLEHGENRSMGLLKRTDWQKLTKGKRVRKDKGGREYIQKTNLA